MNLVTLALSWGLYFIFLIQESYWLLFTKSPPKLFEFEYSQVETVAKGLSKHGDLQ